MKDQAQQYFSSTILGSARIGERRELKRAVESYWTGASSADDLTDVARALRLRTLNRLHDGGLDAIPVGDFSLYDHVLDASALLGALPPRFDAAASELDRYFAAARGSDTAPPMEMTKWFDTNYHYLVPEIGVDTRFTLNSDKLINEIKEAVNAGIPVAKLRAVVLGPISYLLLAKSTDGSAPLDRINDLVPLYRELLARIADEGVPWVQLDEPVLVADRTADERAIVSAVYNQLSAREHRPAILVATYFGELGESAQALADTGIEAVAVDLVAGAPADLPGKLIVAGIVDGRNVWRTDLDAALTKLRQLDGPVAVSTSCSLLHVPYTLDAEPDLDDALRGWLAFGYEKLYEITALAHALTGNEYDFTDARNALALKATDPRIVNDQVRARVAALTPADADRASITERAALQASRLSLPELPTTTIGSFPQTSAIRVARQHLRNGIITPHEYLDQMRAEIAACIALQEDLGLDVLVHGEAERNDMVQYFADQLDGFFSSQNAWVQSYGSRCVRPPILFGDVSRPSAMTVEWTRYAQSLTSKPVKGMLTGPVTILAWSFVRDDQPLADTAAQVALVIRDECIDLEAAGTALIQVDEPALRELLPLRTAAQQAYLDWSVRAFRIATSGVRDETQIHTHLCYSEFGEVIDAIAGLNADVTSIEAARSAMEILDDLAAAGFAAGVGPGVYDIHSPRVPSVDELLASLRSAAHVVDGSKLWVNPDCGLKTRREPEVRAALANMVAAARTVRAEAEHSVTAS